MKPACTLVADDSNRIRAVRTKLQQRRRGLMLHCATVDANIDTGGAPTWPSCRRIADAFISGLGYTPCDDWHAIDRSIAEGAIAYVLERDLAYHQPNMPVDEARKLAKDFLELFDEGCCFFSTGDTEDDEFKGSEARGSITDATFDKGVVVVDGPRVGMLWVTDED